MSQRQPTVASKMGNFYAQIYSSETFRVPDPEDKLFKGQGIVHGAKTKVNIPKTTHPNPRMDIYKENPQNGSPVLEIAALAIISAKPKGPKNYGTSAFSRN